MRFVAARRISLHKGRSILTGVCVQKLSLATAILPSFGACLQTPPLAIPFSPSPKRGLDDSVHQLARKNAIPPPQDLGDVWGKHSFRWWPLSQPSRSLSSKTPSISWRLMKTNLQVYRLAFAGWDSTIHATGPSSHVKTYSSLANAKLAVCLQSLSRGKTSPTRAWPASNFPRNRIFVFFQRAGQQRVLVVDESECFGRMEMSVTER